VSEQAIFRERIGELSLHKLQLGDIGDVHVECGLSRRLIAHRACARSLGPQAPSAAIRSSSDNVDLGVAREPRPVFFGNRAIGIEIEQAAARLLSPSWATRECAAIAGLHSSMVPSRALNALPQGSPIEQRAIARLVVHQSLLRLHAQLELVRRLPPAPPRKPGQQVRERPRVNGSSSI
jgi:hypothetical protein